MGAGIARPLCGCGCGVAVKTVSARFIAGHNARVPVGDGTKVRLNCAQCGREFSDYPSQEQAYCSKACGYASFTNWSLDNALKKRFVGQLRARQIGVPAAASEIGVKAITLYMWLQRPGHCLSTRTLNAVASWLSLDAAQATALQGRTMHDKMQAVGRQAAASPNHPSQRVRSDPTYRRAFAQRVSAAGRGRTESLDTRRRKSEGIKQAFARSGYRPTGAHKKTLRGRAQQMVRTLRYWHPDWTAGQIEADAIRRLMLPPFNVPTIEAAAALLVPKPKKRPIKRRAARRPDRCRILHELDAETRRTSTGRRPAGFLREYERRVQIAEGHQAPTYERLKVWVKDHERSCPDHGARRRR